MEVVGDADTHMISSTCSSRLSTSALPWNSRGDDVRVQCAQNEQCAQYNCDEPEFDTLRIVVCFFRCARSGLCALYVLRCIWKHILIHMWRCHVVLTSRAILAQLSQLYSVCYTALNRCRLRCHDEWARIYLACWNRVSGRSCLMETFARSDCL